MKNNDEAVSKSYFDKKMNEVMEKLDWIIGKYRNHDEEHTLIGDKLSEHSDEIEKIENKLGIIPE